MNEIAYTDNTLITDFEVIETDAQTAAQDTGDTNTPYPYDPMKINISNYNWSIDTIRQMLNRKLIVFSPNFRKNFVWDYTRKSRLIESILLGIPIPAFYLVKNEKGNFPIIDGFQRLTTIKEFLNNEFKLIHLEYFTGRNNTDNLEGLYYQTKDNKNGINVLKNGEYEFKIFSTLLNINVIASTASLEIQTDIFMRLNK